MAETYFACNPVIDFDLVPALEYAPYDRLLNLAAEINTENDVVSAPESINQVSFDMNCFGQRVKEFDLMGTDEIVSNSVKESTFGVIEETYDQGFHELGLELRLGFSGQDYDNDNDGDDDYNLMATDEIASKTVNYSISGEFVDNHDVGHRNLDLGLRLGLADRGCNNRDYRIEDCNCGDDFSAARNFNGSSSRGVLIESDSDDEIEVRMEVEGNDDDLLGMNIRSDEGEDIVVDNVVAVGDYSVSPYSESFHLGEEDRVEVNHDFELGEVDFLGLGEGEGMRFMAQLEFREDSILAVNTSGSEEDGDRGSGASELVWSVLINDIHMTLDFESHYLGEAGDFNMAEYEMVFGQFADGENSNLGRPPASEATIENLPLVVITEKHVVDENSVCAVCTDQIKVGEMGSHLPCSHLYHGGCIIPWLRIRNTCPVCRFELPTDDPDYEHRKARRSAHLA